jgi:D-alanine-D-alanine ligase-like ATP-grasp enzyme
MNGFSTQRRHLSTRLLLLRRVGLRHLLRERPLRARHRRLRDDTATQAAQKIWQEAADALGAETRRVSTFLEFRLGSKTTRISLQITTPFTDRVSWLLMADKAASLQLLAEAGLPVPAQVVVDADDVAAGTAFLAQATLPLTVKPVGGAGGSGVVGHVQTAQQLKAALTSAGRLDARVLIEHQVPGECYRLLFLDDELLDVIKRPSPRITGDGTSSVEELIFHEFERRIALGGDAAGYKPLNVDLDCLFTLEYGGYRLDSVPTAGSSVTIKTATNYSGPELTTTLERPFEGAIVEPARRAAEILGARLAGVDVVTTDPYRPLHETGGAILEVNMPGLEHHYHVADPARATPVAVPILAELLGARTPAGADWPRQAQFSS